jgi:uncharacterized protein YbaA (DUF1428 family)
MPGKLDRALFKAYAGNSQKIGKSMYVNGYILGVPEENKEAYVTMAKLFAEVAKDFGAVEIFENWEIEVPNGKHTDFRQAIKAKPGEKVVFSWVVWPDRETCDIAHKGMMSDPRMKDMGKIPFDGKRMIMGGFEPIIAYHQS